MNASVAARRELVVVFLVFTLELLFLRVGSHLRVLEAHPLYSSARLLVLDGQALATPHERLFSGLRFRFNMHFLHLQFNSAQLDDVILLE